MDCSSVLQGVFLTHEWNLGLLHCRWIPYQLSHQGSLSVVVVKAPKSYLGYCVLQDIVAAAAKLLQSCPTLCDPIDGSSPGSPVLGFSRQERWSGLPFLLQCMKVKSESEVAQSCLTLCDLMDCSLPGSSIHGIFQARVLSPSPI